ncbi:NAD-dependent dehydratase [Candidatus Uhrbacteria bacterium RIFCSPLOWO2_01_FULL_53_9]|uniref:NAD-dependent dehydratase n=2 Tax=Candidatus Uhriibacteriota TaxID=1752732 RepID=A0A1F7UWN3_9BACT|nr:MAG: NAD-dependent dehydratase [Candidatus Uhrbacteria bacterium RIFCSPLOWO2_01_FULL_53_9]OGL89774.1 MAG: NAD-dependent dehydratase [Candidatus Uhrbacteria bacterium RIFCSPLOWO2_02_FULL_53_10]
MNILLVGGAGYLGGALTDLLQETPHAVRVYDRLLYEESYRKNVPFVLGDVRDTATLQPHLDWADVVVWLAALVGDGACALNEALTLEVNRDALQYAADHFDGRMLFLSSCSVYGAMDGLLHEASALHPLSLYARTKLWGEEMLAKKNAISFRLGTLYGLSDRFARVRFDLVVNTLVMRAVLHKNIEVFGGAQFRPHLHVFDAARVLVNQLESSAKGVFNLHGENLTVMEVANKVKRRLPETHVEVTTAPFEDLRNYSVTSEKAARELGFCPKRTVDEGIDEIAALLQEGRVTDSFLSRYSNYLYLKPLLQSYTSPLGEVLTSSTS